MTGRYATGVRLPDPVPCSPDADENGCTVLADTCTCRVPEGCSEDVPGCCHCAHLDPYDPCPAFGFGCGPDCDCCTPRQQRLAYLLRQAPPSKDRACACTRPPHAGKPCGGTVPPTHGICVDCYAGACPNAKDRS